MSCRPQTCVKIISCHFGLFSPCHLGCHFFSRPSRGASVSLSDYFNPDFGCCRFFSLLRKTPFWRIRFRKFMPPRITWQSSNLNIIVWANNCVACDIFGHTRAKNEMWRVYKWGCSVRNVKEPLNLVISKLRLVNYLLLVGQQIVNCKKVEGNERWALSQ